MEYGGIDRDQVRERERERRGTAAVFITRLAEGETNNDGLYTEHPVIASDSTMISRSPSAEDPVIPHAILLALLAPFDLGQKSWGIIIYHGVILLFYVIGCPVIPNAQHHFYICK